MKKMHVLGLIISSVSLTLAPSLVQAESSKTQLKNKVVNVLSAVTYSSERIVPKSIFQSSAFNINRHLSK